MTLTVKKTLRLGIFSLSLLTSMVCLLALSLYLALQTDAGRTRLLALINWQLTKAQGTEIVIRAMHGNPFQHFTIEGLTLLDNSEELLRLDTAILEWRPAALLEGVFHVTSLQLSGLQVNSSTLQTSKEAA